MTALSASPSMLSFAGKTDRCFLEVHFLCLISHLVLHLRGIKDLKKASWGPHLYFWSRCDASCSRVGSPRPFGSVSMESRLLVNRGKKKKKKKQSPRFVSRAVEAKFDGFDRRVNVREPCKAKVHRVQWSLCPQRAHTPIGRGCVCALDGHTPLARPWDGSHHSGACGMAAALCFAPTRPPCRRALVIGCHSQHSHACCRPFCLILEVILYRNVTLRPSNYSFLVYSKTLHSRWDN